MINFPTRRTFIAASCTLCVTAALALAGCSAPQNTEQSSPADNATDDTRLEVVASFYPMYDFAQKIGGDRVLVTNLVPAGTEPHDWEPSTTDIATLSDADILVYNGAGMEHWVDDTLAGLSNSKLVSVEASHGVELLALDEAHEHEADEHGHEGEAANHEADEHGHDHGDFDPHVWLDPQNAKIEMANIRDAFTAADPEGADVYAANYDKYAAELDALDNEFKTELEGVSQRTIVVSHEAFGYLAHAYNLEQLPIEGIEADAEPDAKTMADIANFVKEHNVRVIFSEELVSPKVAQSIAHETGASVEELNPIEGLSEEDLSAGADYLSVMRSNLETLKGALS